LKHLSIASLGVIGIIFGSDLLVQSSVAFAEWAGVSEVVIGATIIAVGTSLPELVTSATAALRGYKEIAIGNILGSNVFNVAAVLGTAALIRPIAPTTNLIMVDLPFMVGITALLLLFMKSGWEISRKEAAILLAAYIAFLCFQFI
jgi:cation:H+ antiporter